MTSMTKRNWWAWFLSFGGMALVTTPFAAFFSYKWLAFDEPNLKYECKGGSTCYSGETTNMIIASLFGAFAVIFIGVTIVVVYRWRRWRLAQQRVPTQLSAQL